MASFSQDVPKYLSLVLQIPCENVFRHRNPIPKPLAEGIGAEGFVFVVSVFLLIFSFVPNV